MFYGSLQKHNKCSTVHCKNTINVLWFIPKIHSQKDQIHINVKLIFIIYLVKVNIHINLTRLLTIQIFKKGFPLNTFIKLKKIFMTNEKLDRD